MSRLLQGRMQWLIRLPSSCFMLLDLVAFFVWVLGGLRRFLGVDEGRKLARTEKKKKRRT